ncbi:MAG: hypothetical protein ACLSE4_04015 [Clostridium sp.]
MSVVGPRPERPELAAEIETRDSGILLSSKGKSRTHGIRPGIRKI